MPWLKKGARTYTGWLYDESGRYAVTLGTTDADTARAIEAFGAELAARRRWPVIADIRAGRYSLAEAYDHRQDLEAFVADRTMPDLNDLIDEWEPTVEGTSYYAQARVLVRPGQRFPLSEFRRARVAQFLKELPVSVQTRRRYKVALSSLAKFLLERELIETNPTRDVSLGRAPRRPVIRLEPQEVAALIAELPAGKYQAIEALMAGTGMEWQACAALLRRDIDEDRRLVFARGEKNDYRTRWVEFTEDAHWDAFIRHARLFVGEARIFADVNHRSALREHQRAAERASAKLVERGGRPLRYTILHHHRHSYAVAWLPRVMNRDDGRDVAWLKNQLGHAPQSMQLYTTYAVEIKAAQLTQAQQERLTAAPAKRAKGVARR